MKKNLSNLFLLLLFTVPAAAQTIVKGKVTASEDGAPVSGAHISAKSTAFGTIADENGNYQLQLPPGTYVLEASSVGYKSASQTIEAGTTPSTADFVLSSDAVELQELVVLGSRSARSRTNIDKPVPVDVITQKEVKLYAQNDITQSLNYAAPSFNANRQSIAGGTDHIDPASLRGLGPDQVLVMVNGKRRHTSALVNINASFGRGTVGTDMNSIPMAAIERIEILRDGAAAQYGSDAIAGVINLVLKKKSPLIVSSTYGQSYTRFLGKTLTDGQNTQFDFTKGFDLGKKGVINISAQYLNRGYTNRGGEDTRPLLYSNFRLNKKTVGETEEQYQAAYKQAKNADDAKAQAAGLDRQAVRVGNSDMENIGAFVNAEYALASNLSAYAALGFSNKKGKAGGFYRWPVSTNQLDLSIYPNGFLPFTNTSVTDISAIAGLRGELDKWSFDMSNTFGANIIGFRASNTLNASLPEGTSPREFDGGKLSFAQNTINLDLSRRLTFDRTLSALNIAFGSEFRTDNYIISESEELSYSFGQPSKNIPGRRGQQAGAQASSSYRPSNALNKNRINAAFYADFEQEFGPKLLTEVAGRLESYSDFGSNFSGKASARWKVFQDIALRGAIATGFRAPSLHQRYYNSENTFFVQGSSVPTRVLTVNNDNPVVRQFGAGHLKPEISESYSAGITGKLFHKLIFTIDAYQINIRDRIVFSSLFTRQRDRQGNPVPTDKVNQILNTVDPDGNINSVQFFTNAIGTRTRGLDIVVSDKFVFGKHSLHATAAANFNKTEVTSVKPPDAIASNAALTENLFDRRERARFEMGIPRSKINLALTYAVSKYSVLLRTVRFGMVGNRHAKDPAASNGALPLDIDQNFSAKWITDLVFSYKIFKNLDFTAGGNNIFDIYPDRMYIDPRNNPNNLASASHGGYTSSRDNTNNGTFIYSRDAMQFGFNGRYVYGKLTFTF